MGRVLLTHAEASWNVRGDAKLAFKIIDTNGDGTLSFDEYANAVISYFADTEVNKYAFSFGLLKNVPADYSGEVDAALKTVKDA